MKKLLMILICGFAFTQSIQTKQIEVPVTQDTESIDISDYLDLIEGYYNVELIYIEELSTTLDDSMSRIKFVSEISNTGKMELEIFNYGPDVPTNYYYAYQPCMIDIENSILNNSSDDDLYFFSGTMILRITGLFEDELMPDVGDMNLDGNINVVDVVVLVNSILGIG